MYCIVANNFSPAKYLSKSTCKSTRNVHQFKLFRRRLEAIVTRTKTPKLVNHLYRNKCSRSHKFEKLIFVSFSCAFKYETNFRAGRSWESKFWIINSRLRMIFRIEISAMKIRDKYVAIESPSSTDKQSDERNASKVSFHIFHLVKIERKTSRSLIIYKEYDLNPIFCFISPTCCFTTSTSCLQRTENGI